QQLAIARRDKDRRSEANALGSLGIGYKHGGRLDLAIECYQQQLAIARELHDRRGEGSALFNMSLALYELGQTAQAITQAQASLRIFEQVSPLDVEKVRTPLAAWYRGASVDSP